MKLKLWEERMKAGLKGTLVVLNDFAARGWKCRGFGPSQSCRILRVYPSVLMAASSQMAVVLQLPIIQAKLL